MYIYTSTHTNVLCVSESCITNISDLVLESNLMAGEFFVPNIFLRRLASFGKADSVVLLDGGWSRQGGGMCGIRQKCEFKQSVVEWQLVIATSFYCCFCCRWTNYFPA